MPESADQVQRDTSHFDEAAATWDDNPQRRALTGAIAGAIREAVPLKLAWRMLEYGCGTGALGFLLAPSVREVVAADASPGMIAQVSLKLARHPAVRMLPLVLDLMHDPVLPDKFEAIVTAMALHHVEDVESILTQLRNMLAEDGWLIIADLCREDGSFHAPMKVPHNGFDPDRMADAVSRVLGQAECRHNIVHRMEKNNRTYNVFLLVAQRLVASSPAPSGRTGSSAATSP